MTEFESFGAVLVDVGTEAMSLSTGVVEVVCGMDGMAGVGRSTVI